MLRVVLSNCSPDESNTLARALIEERLAACVNVLPSVTSCYVWEGEYCEDEEHTLLIKTTEGRYPAMKERLEELHSYDVPEIIALDVDDVFEPYARWAHEQTS
ncbi:MAG: divalent-cation tolerance protein CutA [Persicimonas sp.]